MVALVSHAKTRFKLGTLVATPGAIAALQRSGEDPAAFVERHCHGDWGDVDAHDRQANDAAVAHEGDPDRQERVLSAYTTRTGDRLWVLTEHDRSVTTFLCPDEY